VKIKVEGLRELDAALGALAAEYGKTAGKAVLRRVADKALQPMAETARQLAPDDPATVGKDLKASITFRLISGWSMSMWSLACIMIACFIWSMRGSPSSSPSIS